MQVTNGYLRLHICIRKALTMNASIDSRNSSEALVAELDRKTKRIFSLPFFRLLSQGLSGPQWRYYAKQFDVTCKSFDRLLDAVCERTACTDNKNLSVVLTDNRADELGLPSGIPHKILRSDFFRAIGLPQSEIDGTSSDVSPSSGVLRHASTINKIIANGSLEELVGAFIAQEYLANSNGFEILRKGVIASFPDLNSTEHAAMRYIFGHIECDGDTHLPKLLDAIKPMLANPDTRNEIYKGAKAVLDAEYDLFKSLYTDIQGRRSHKILNNFQDSPLASNGYCQ
jgi:hypothetical protein